MLGQIQIGSIKCGLPVFAFNLQMDPALLSEVLFANFHHSLWYSFDNYTGKRMNNELLKNGLFKSLLSICCLLTCRNSSLIHAIVLADSSVIYEVPLEVPQLKTDTILYYLIHKLMTSRK